MHNLQALILSEISHIKKKLTEIKKINKKRETLKIQEINNRPFYYRQYKDENGKVVREYIAKNEMQYIKRLAQQAYDQKIKTILERNLKALQMFDGDAIQKIYENMTVYRRELVVPYEMSINEIIRRWKAENYEKYMGHMESLRFETEEGEMVRSKSEVIIANMLYRQKDNLSYRYEKPLVLENRGRKYTLHPDFTILNLKTGRILYWEHMGKMDDLKYVSDFVWKANMYLMNDCEVVYTYESGSNPLEIRTVKKIIQDML